MQDKHRTLNLILTFMQARQEVQYCFRGVLTGMMLV